VKIIKIRPLKIIHGKNSFAAVPKVLVGYRFGNKFYYSIKIIIRALSDC